MSENRTTDPLNNVVYNSYDGAAVMPAQLEGLQETFPSALFIYCFTHKLNWLIEWLRVTILTDGLLPKFLHYKMNVTSGISKF